ALTTLVSLVHAQDAPAADPPPVSVYPEAYTPSWSDNDIALIAKQLAGSWKTVSAVDSGRNEDGSVATTDLLLNIAPVAIDGLSDTLYVESFHAQTPWAPYRQAVFQLYRYKGEVRLRTYEITVGSESLGAYSAMWAVPEYFPQLSSDQMIATLDVDLEPTSTGFTGSTPYPYPTGSGGAVEMTSSLTLDGDTLTTADRGYDADGNVVWGAGENDSYTFVRTESPITVTKHDNGLAVLQIGGQGEEIVQIGDKMHVHYSGYLMDGSRFDSSSTRGVPYGFTYPPGSGAIEGFGSGMDGFALNDHRKLVFPGALGYKERGNPRAGIEPNAALLFDVHLVQIDKAQKPVVPAPPAQD
ncbi:MAG: FKBP-type peptidyl-prolyl cis-trans isomerase, partial [Phycisphaerales bacterium]|nr:FKBP-type peptidyl-prolyl cis-trans isomerase [Phycisphaerales bacterium]